MPNSPPISPNVPQFPPSDRGAVAVEVANGRCGVGEEVGGVGSGHWGKWGENWAFPHWEIDPLGDAGNSGDIRGIGGH